MESRVEQTALRHKKGYNCAQAVLCTYCDLFGVDEATAFRMAEGLGLGMGNMEGTCGAMTAACMLAGMKNSTVNLEQPDSKGGTYRLCKALMNRFGEIAGSVICRELKGVETGKVLFSCPDCIRTAAELTEEILLKDQ